MPLIHDPEYQTALEHFVAKTKKTSRKILAVHIALCVGLGISVLVLSNQLSGSELVAATMVLSTTLLIYVVNIAVRILWTNLVIISTIIEWVGRKQLGEYEPPE